MTESGESGTEHTTAATERRTFGSAPPYDDRRGRANLILVWVGIVAGVVFIVAVIFFAGVFVGRNSGGNFRGGYHQPGMMGPGQSGQFGQMWPGMAGPGGMMGPGGIMGPSGPGPIQQSPPTTSQATPRP